MSPESKSSSKLMPVSTILTPGERQRVDAAGEGLYSALHRESFDEVLADLRERRAGAVLISIARYGLHSSARMAAMVREFPRVPAMALLTETQYSTPQNLLALGQLGVRILIDARQPEDGRHCAIYSLPSARTISRERRLVSSAQTFREFQQTAGISSSCCSVILRRSIRFDNWPGR